jgi:hypothetical protein
MSRPAYSTNFFNVATVSGPTHLGTVPSNEVWVLRSMFATFGTFAGYVAAAVGLSAEGPWSWLCQSTGARIIGVQHQTFQWEGRKVFEPLSEVWVNTSTSDTGDLDLNGYVLSYTGAPL